MTSIEDFIPIDARDEFEIFGKEFLIQVQGYASRDRKLEAMTVAQKIRRYCSDLVAKVRGREISHIEDYDGAMMEIVSRELHDLRGYLWPTINSIVYENGEPVGKSIPADEDIRGFIFVPNTYGCLGGKYFITGVAKVYNHNDNTVGQPLERKVSIRYKKVPEFKSPIRLS